MIETQQRQTPHPNGRRVMRVGSLLSNSSVFEILSIDYDNGTLRKLPEWWSNAGYDETSYSSLFGAATRDTSPLLRVYALGALTTPASKLPVRNFPGKDISIPHGLGGYKYGLESHDMISLYIMDRMGNTWIPSLLRSLTPRSRRMFARFLTKTLKREADPRIKDVCAKVALELLVHDVELDATALPLFEAYMSECWRSKLEYLVMLLSHRHIPIRWKIAADYTIQSGLSLEIPNDPNYGFQKSELGVYAKSVGETLERMGWRSYNIELLTGQISFLIGSIPSQYRHMLSVNNLWPAIWLLESKPWAQPLAQRLRECR